MSENYYKKALQAARLELEELMRQKDKTDQRIAQLRQTIVSLSALNKDEATMEEDKVYIPSVLERAAREAAMQIAATTAGAASGKTIGFTDAVREVLKANGGQMNPTQVREGLLMMGINLERKYTNPLAVIHTTLKRLEDNGEVKIETINNVRTYRWKTLLAPSVPTPPVPKIRRPTLTPSHEGSQNSSGIKPRTAKFTDIPKPPDTFVRPRKKE